MEFFAVSVCCRLSPFVASGGEVCHGFELGRTTFTHTHAHWRTRCIDLTKSLQKPKPQNVRQPFTLRFPNHIKVIVSFPFSLCVDLLQSSFFDIRLYIANVLFLKSRTDKKNPLTKKFFFHSAAGIFCSVSPWSLVAVSFFYFHHFRCQFKIVEVK